MSTVVIPLPAPNSPSSSFPSNRGALPSGKHPPAPATPPPPDAAKKKTDKLAFIPPNSPALQIPARPSNLPAGGASPTPTEKQPPSVGADGAAAPDDVTWPLAAAAALGALVAVGMQIWILV